MTFSGDAWEAIKDSYQVWVNARCELTNYDANREFADFAPNYTLTKLDGSLLTLQQLHQELENAHKTARKWATYLNYERFDDQGQQATVVLFMREEVSHEYPSDIENRLKLVPNTSISVLQHTWQKTYQGWKRVRCHILHGAVSEGQPEYVSFDDPKITALKESLYLQQKQHELDFLRALTLGAAYSYGTKY